MANRRSRSLLVAGVVLSCVAAGFSAVVLPHPGSRIVAVSRYGHDVRLLPAGISLSFLPLAGRLDVPLRDDHTLVRTTLDATTAGGPALRIPIEVELDGSGPLPIDAGEVREHGWPEAWRRRLAGAVALTDGQLHAFVSASSLWHEIFPSAQALPVPDLRDALAESFRPLTVARVTVGAPDPELVRSAARRKVAQESRAAGRLVLLGLDALDWKLVDDLTARGLMPNLARLVRRGAQAVHEVPPPLISPVVWNTIGTGVPPQVHGVLDFLEPDPGGGAPRPVTSASRKAPAIWEMAAAAGRTTAVVGWWATFPAAAPPRGTVYSDRLTEQLLGLTAETPGLADPPAAEANARRLAVRARDVTPAMVAPLAAVSDGELAAVESRGDAWDEPLGGLVKLVAATLTVERLTDHELGRGTDIVFSYLEGTDIVGHLFGAYRPPAMRGTDPALLQKYGPVVDRYHGFVDAWVGRVVAGLKPEDTLVIVSDHGFAWGENRPHAPSGTHTATATLWHRPEGVFLAVGPRVRSSATRHRLGVLDVGPTLLALAGLPPAAEMPGHVPEWLLASAGEGRAAVRYRSLVAAPSTAAAELSPEARDEALAKLRALGYIAGPAASVPHTSEPEPAAAPPPAPAPTPAFDRAAARRLNNLAISQASSGERGTAEDTFKRAIAADPNYAPAYYSYSTMLRRQLRLDEADVMFWTAVRLGVQEGEMAVVRLALDYQARGMAAKGREVLAEGRRQFPNSAVVWLNSGVFLGDRGDLDGAAACLRRAVQLAPDNAAAHRNLAVALLGLGRTEEARKALMRVVEIDPSDTAARQQLDALGRSGP